MTDTPAPTYDEAIARIEQIVAQLDDDDVSIDELAPLVDEAAALIARCRDVLQATETRVSDALEALQRAADGEA